MADWWETAMFKCVAFVALLGFAIPSSAAVDVSDDPSEARNPRVRPHDSRAASVLLQGLERSETVRQIVNELEARDVIVYVETHPGLRRDLAGRMVWLAATQVYRYVRVSLNPELSTETLVSVLGHELQHVLEVAVSPSIVDERSLEAYYKEYGFNMRTHANGWDTQAARDTGDLVRRELIESSARDTGGLARAIEPSAWPGVYQRTRDRFTSR